MVKQDLTLKQKKVLKFICESIRFHNLPPTIREIAKKFGFSSTGTVRDYLKVLVDKGYIKVSAHKSRAIELVREAIFSFPILGNVQAGLPTLAVEEIEGYLNLDSLVFSEPSKTNLYSFSRRMIGFSSGKFFTGIICSAT